MTVTAVSYTHLDVYKRQNLNNGICVVGDDRTVRNMYETDYFREICDIAYGWNQAGYVVKDASVVTDANFTLVEAGRAASYIIGYAYSAESVEAMSLTKADPYETVAIPLSKDMMSPITLTWGIAYTCKDPAAAARVLNMLYTDEFVLNTLIFGVEGSDWVDAGTGDGSILWPEGKDMNSVPYTAALTCGIIGNQFKMYSMAVSYTHLDVYKRQGLSYDGYITVSALEFMQKSTFISMALLCVEMCIRDRHRYS